MQKTMECWTGIFYIFIMIIQEDQMEVQDKHIGFIIQIISMDVICIIKYELLFKRNRISSLDKNKAADISY